MCTECVQKWNPLLLTKVTLRTALDKMKTTLQFTPSAAFTEKYFGTDIYIYIYICVYVYIYIHIYIYTPHPQFQNFDIQKSDASSHSTFHKHTMSKHSCKATMMSCDTVSHSLFRSN